MQRRTLLGLLGSIGASGCLGKTDTARVTEKETTTGKATSQAQTATHTRSETRTNESQCGPQYLRFRDWFEAYRTGVSVREIGVYSEITVSTETSESKRVHLPDGRKFLASRIALKNTSNESREPCRACHGFGVAAYDMLVARCRTEFPRIEGSPQINQIEQSFDVPAYPPEGVFEPEEVREIQVGALVGDQFDRTQLRIGYDGTGRGYEAQWLSEKASKPTDAYCSEA